MFKHFSLWILENETFDHFFAKSAKEEGGGDSENSGKNPLSQTRCICGWTLTFLQALSGDFPCDFLENNKSFQSEIKLFFLVSQMVSFRLLKKLAKM